MLSWGSPRIGPLTTKGGSEESGSSSSSQSSIDLEDVEDDGDLHEDGHLKHIDGSFSKHSQSLSCPEVDNEFGVGKAGQSFKVQSKISYRPPIHLSAHIQSGEAVVCQSFLKCSDPTQEGITDHTKDTVDQEPVASKSNEGTNNEICHEITCNTSDAAGCSAEEAETTVKDSFGNKTAKDVYCGADADAVKLNTSSAVRKVPFCSPPVNVMDPKRDETEVKALNHVQNKGRATSMNCVRAKTQTNQSFNILPHKNRTILNPNKLKNNLKCSSAQVKDKARKSPELLISGEANVTSVKSKLKSVRVAHCISDVLSPRKKTIDHLHSRKANADKMDNNRQQHPAVRALRSTRQLKSPGAAATPRSQSAVDFITYKDMFKQIQSEDEGPAMYEMFAGPIYDNLRVPSSCDDRQVQSASSRLTQQTYKVKHRPLKQAQSKLRRSPAEMVVVPAKSKSKPVSSRMKKRKSKKEKIPRFEAELFLNKNNEICHDDAQGKDEGPVLPTIEEALPGCGSETFTRHINMQETKINSAESKIQTGNQPVPEPSLPQSPERLRIDTWTSSHSSDRTVMSAVYQRFLDDVGDGPLTDDLLQCLAEELISLDERDVSIGPDNLELSRNEFKNEDDPVFGRNKYPEVNLKGKLDLHIPHR